MLKIVLVPINPAGWPFIGIFAAATLGLFMVAEPLGWIGVVLTVWCAYFFRDPDRITPTRGGLVISPADGVVQLIDKAVPPPELDMGDKQRPRVCVFMNVFNVHVNRVPADGKVEVVHYRAGRFFNASFDKASIHNERQSVRMKTLNGDDIVFVQIAGLIARRIRSTLTVGNDVQAGSRFGLIRFGSRLDVYLPDGMEPKLTEGQSMVAGETVIAISGDHKKGNAVS